MYSCVTRKPWWKRMCLLTNQVSQLSGSLVFHNPIFCVWLVYSLHINFIFHLCSKHASMDNFLFMILCFCSVYLYNFFMENEQEIEYDLYTYSVSQNYVNTNMDCGIICSLLNVYRVLFLCWIWWQINHLANICMFVNKWFLPFKC